MLVNIKVHHHKWIPERLKLILNNYKCEQRKLKNVPTNFNNKSENFNAKLLTEWNWTAFTTHLKALSSAVATFTGNEFACMKGQLTLLFTSLQR